MKTMTKAALLVFLLAGIAAISSNCIMEDRVVEVVLSDSTCAGWYEYHTSASYVNDATLDYASEIDRILADNDLSRDDLVSAHVVNVTYELTDFSHTHDWEVTGYVTVERSDIADGPAQVFEYTDETISVAKVGTVVNAPLTEGGVGILNRALADYIEGGNPVLVFRVSNSGVSPSPSVSDPIQFTWQACIYIQVITTMDVEVPNVF